MSELIKEIRICIRYKHMIQTIVCPHCKKPVEISQALRQQFEEELLAAEKERHQKELDQARQEANEQFIKQIRLLNEDLEQKKKQLANAQQAELAFRKEKNKLADEKQAFELENQRQLDREREAIRQKAKEEESEKNRLNLKEKEQQLESMRKTIDELERKGKQGSQQLQGEVQELDLEETLRATFPNDIITPVGKGILGADIRHIVKSPMGVVCGTILWESKRTKAWSDAWIGKLKTDLLSDRANIPAVISETVPEEAKTGIGLKDGVWIAIPKLAVPLALLLRKTLLDVAKQKKISENKQTKAEELYGFVTSHDFQHQVEAMIEIYKDMQEQIAKERIVYERSWKQREIQVQRLLSGVAGIYGSMQGISGQALLPIHQLELPSSDG